MYSWTDGAYLMHHGILGQKWGVRRYQNSDGTLTEAGKARYYNSDGSLNSRGQRRMKRAEKVRDRNVSRLKVRANWDQSKADKYRKSAENLRLYGTRSDEYKEYADSTYESIDGSDSIATDFAMSLGNAFLKKSQENSDVQQLIAEYEKSAEKYEDAVKNLTNARSKIMNMPLSVVTGKRDVRRVSIDARRRSFDTDSESDIFDRVREQSIHFKQPEKKDDDEDW